MQHKIHSLHYEQLYSLIVLSGSFSPLGKKTANSTFYDTYLFHINFFLLEVQLLFFAQPKNFNRKNQNVKNYF
jgi:hypothetical protein